MLNNKISKIIKGSFLTFFITSYLYSFDISNIKTYKADFNQIITNPQNKVLQYSGKLYIKYPSLILWDYLKPIEKSIYIKGENVTIIEPDLEQAIVTKLNKNIDIFNIFKNAKKISTDLYRALFNDRNYYITLSNNQIKTISYQDELDNKITISFDNVVQNKTISNNIFEFIIPLEYDIIRK